MYEFNTKLKMPFDQAMEKVNKAISAEKLGVVSDINVQGIMKKKMDKDIAPYRILGACAPDLALKVIESEPNGGALLPCNVVVREDESGDVVVSFMEPKAVLELANNAALDSVIKDARARLDRVFSRLEQL
jgi:uncharacterized protein (DUF302 family)